MSSTPLTTANLAHRDEAIHPNEQGGQARIEFDLTAIGSHLVTGTQNSVMKEDLNGIVADVQSYRTGQARDQSGGGAQVASGLNARMVAWQYNVDDVPVGWRSL
jgi:hypothetical protein